MAPQKVFDSVVCCKLYVIIPLYAKVADMQQIQNPSIFREDCDFKVYISTYMRINTFSTTTNFLNRIITIWQVKKYKTCLLNELV